MLWRRTPVRSEKRARSKKKKRRILGIDCDRVACARHFNCTSTPSLQHTCFDRPAHALYTHLLVGSLLSSLPYRRDHAPRTQNSKHAPEAVLNAKCRFACMRAVCMLVCVECTCRPIVKSNMQRRQTNPSQRKSDAEIQFSHTKQKAAFRCAEP
jgi:hypothetical protein